jgi:uncharacterized protein YggE
LGAATENARQRAGAIAAGDNRKVGRMISAEYASHGGEVVRPANFLRSAKVMAADIDAGGGLVSKDTEVSVSVSATFEIR